MNLFEFFVRLTHHRSSGKWVTAEAVFTGKKETAVIRTRLGPKKASYNAYEIMYNAGGKKQFGWYTFHPLPDPDPEDIANTKIRIRYQKNKPYIFESAPEHEDSVYL